MPLFLAALLGGIYSALGSMVGKVLVSLGIGYVTYSGVNVALDFFKAEAFEKINAAGSVVPGLLYFAGVFQVGTCFNILFSAWTARLVIQGVTSGTFKRMVQK